MLSHPPSDLSFTTSWWGAGSADLHLTCKTTESHKDNGYVWIWIFLFCLDFEDPAPQVTKYKLWAIFWKFILESFLLIQLLFLESSWHLTCGNQKKKKNHEGKWYLRKQNFGLNLTLAFKKRRFRTLFEPQRKCCASFIVVSHCQSAVLLTSCPGASDCSERKKIGNSKHYGDTASF